MLPRPVLSGAEVWSLDYLAGDVDLKVQDKKTLQRFQVISVLPEKEKECMLTTVDHFIKSAKINAM
jgi:hypothetical protein